MACSVPALLPHHPRCRGSARLTTIVGGVAVTVALLLTFVEPCPGAAAERMSPLGQGGYVGVLGLVDTVLGPLKTVPLAAAEGAGWVVTGLPREVGLRRLDAATLQGLLQLREELTRTSPLLHDRMLLGPDVTAITIGGEPLEDPAVAQQQRLQLLPALGVLARGREALRLALRAIEAYAAAYDRPESARLRIEARALNCTFHAALLDLLVRDPRSAIERGELDRDRYTGWVAKQSGFLDQAQLRTERVCAPSGGFSATRPPSAAAETTADGTTTIRYTPGQRILVDVRLDGHISARLILDTGADRTMISPSILRAAALSPRGTATLRGVTGEARVDLYDIASLEVGGARVGGLTVFAHDSGEPGSDGLLGRDFLDQFTVTIDSAAGRVTLGLRAATPSQAAKALDDITADARREVSPNRSVKRSATAWVLWAEVTTRTIRPRPAVLETDSEWSIVSAYDGREPCEDGRSSQLQAISQDPKREDRVLGGELSVVTRRVDADPERAITTLDHKTTGVRVVLEARYVCLPDTIDPRVAPR